jgi:TonB family protein
MNTTPTRRWIAVGLFLAAVAAPRVAAQHVLLADDAGTMRVVRAATGLRAMVEKDGKLVEISATGFALKEAPEYLPVYVSIRDTDAQSSFAQEHGVGQMNNNFTFRATIETSYALEHVFLVLYITPETGSEAIFLTEIGKLQPNRKQPIIEFVPMDSPLGRGRYSLYLFSDGAEVFQSQIPFFERERVLDRMIGRRVAGIQSAPPKFFIGSPPIYPPALKKAAVRGEAVISVRIDRHGSVNEPVVKSSTDPAFGAAALDAIRDWRFLPRMKDGVPVEARADVPFVFAPPGVP